ncbi:MAG: thiamine pyrophosphate-binding protein [Candidatus Bathyarchaeia archaeon]
MGIKGAEVLATELKRQGVDWVSTLCGNGLFPFYSACTKAGVRLIDFRNEQGAAYMADAYARLTGRVGVCAVSSGVAHCNALTGVANAFFDGAPLVLITGASPGYGGGRGVFQEFDQVALAAPLCKYASVVDKAEDLLFKVRQAFAAVRSGRPGPAHITVTEDALSGEAGEVDAHAPAEGGAVLGEASRGQIRRTLKLISEARSPILVAGSNLFYSGDVSSMIQFCEAAFIPMVVPIWDRGVIDRPHPNYMGVVGAASGEPRLLQDADLAILAGARVDYRVGFLKPPAVREDLRIIRVDIDPGQISQGVTPTVGILGNPGAVFTQLLRGLEEAGRPSPDRLEEAQRRRRLFRSGMTGPATRGGVMTGKDIVEALLSLIGEDDVFLIDGGNIGQWVHMLADRYPRTWLTCGASGVVGFGLPGAMGARAAYPERRVLLLSGDGAFGFTLGEVESASRQGFRFVAVVAVDEAWGIVVSTQRRSLGEEGVIASRLAGRLGVRYDRVAQALGAEGAYAETPQQLREAVIRGFQEDKPTVVHVPIQLGGPADR